MKVYLPDEPALLAYAKELVQYAPENATVFLHGDLGAGKTTFVRGMIKGLGYTGFVKSPTYTLVESYALPFYMIYHFDLYRITDPQELTYLGIEEYFSQNALRMVEWPEKGQGVLSAPDLQLHFSFEKEGRILEISSFSSVGEKWHKGLNESSPKT